MAVGQQVLSGVASLEVLHAAAEQLALCVQVDGRAHAAKLRAVLTWYRLCEADGQGLSGLAEAAKLLRCSPWRANRLLDEGLLLTALPEGLDAVETGILTAEQSAVVVTQLRQVVDLDRRLRLWQRLLERLRRPDAAALPPSRLKELLQRWIVQSDPRDAEERRKGAEADRRVEYRRRDDGLVDILLFGVAAPLAQAVLQRIRDAAEPVGLFDDRLADQRRLDAAVDLLLDRTSCTCASGGGGAGGAVCGCRPGTAVPCGADLKVLVPLGASLGTTDEVATLAGHGPLEPDLLQALLLNGPRLRPVFVDEHGVPVALGPRIPTPEAGDPQALRQALLRLAASAPGRFHPRHPNDHPPVPPDGPPGHGPPSHGSPGDGPPGDGPPGDGSRRSGPPGPADDDRPAGDPAAHPPGDPAPAGDALDATACRPGLSPALDQPHPADQPGPYAVTGLLRELIFLRAPLCEFPGCGVKAENCDAEHDLAHPAGPTCACNLGPCCRSHHRVKQQGWTKTRQVDSGVLWTSPTGRGWLSPSQHQPPQPRLRPLPPLSAPDPLDELSPTHADDELWLLLDRPDDPEAWELRATDHEPQHIDDLGEQLQEGSTRWTLDLDNPYAWTEAEPLL